jgi:hypothetical protein
VTAAPASRSLQAGPLTLELDDGGLRYVRLGDHEVLRRVYVAVRDARWTTIPFVLTALEVTETDGGFAVDLTAEHRQGPVHFRWTGTIRGDVRGTIRYEMNGEALAPFERNRIGICVLHPVDDCAGRPCRVEHADGTVAEERFPVLIAPHQPFMKVRALSHEIEPGLVAEVRFEGDVFETEDQRNWSDHSYKTYSTPLELPKPVRVEAGTRIKQAITLRLVPAALARGAPASRRSEISFGLLEQPAAPLPRLGTTLAPRATSLTSGEIALLDALRLAHLRVELVPSREDFGHAFALAAEAAAALALPLELAVWLGDADAELPLVAAALADRRPPLSAVLVLPLAREASPPAALARARAVFGPSVALAAGSNVHFTELNRNRAGVAGADLVLFPSSPQVHMTDDATLIENLASLPAIAETSRSFSETRPLGMSPVLLRPPPCPPPALGSEDLSSLPRYADARQAGLLAAGWTACHVGRAARAGLARVTYFQATGWRGLLPGVDPLPAELGGTAAVFPVYHVLADIGEMAAAGAEVLATRSSAPLQVDGIVLRAAGRVRLLLVNFTTVSQTVRLAPALIGALKRLGPELGDAIRAPDVFRAAPAEVSGEMLVLGPEQIVRVDSGE